MGIKHLTWSVKMGYYMTMFTDFISFILRISLIVALWLFVWKILEPRTQLMRILRAAVLLLGLLGILVVLRMTGRWLRSFNHTSFYFGVLYSLLVPHKIESCRNLVRGHLDAKKSLPWISHAEGPKDLYLVFLIPLHPNRARGISAIAQRWLSVKKGWGKKVA